MKLSLVMQGKFNIRKVINLLDYINKYKEGSQMTNSVDVILKIW